MWRRVCVFICALGFAAHAAMTAAAAETIRVSVNKLTFVPRQVSAHIGDTIEWVNNDFVAHTATSRDKGWEVAIPAGGSGNVALTSAGDFEYYCRFHPNMIGKISVSAR